MARRPTSPDEEDDEASDEEEEAVPRTSRSRRRPSNSRRPRGPVRRWRGDPDDEDEEDELEPSGTPRKKPPVYWRARDSLYFEPLVALMIVVLLIVGMYAYTQNWPPIYVVESSSMQHGSDYVFGVINTGDLVLAQKVATGSIVPYVTGMQTGYSTYGEYGDVILYLPNGVSTTPIIHRALLFLSWNPNGSYDASDLAGLPCGAAANAVYATPGTLNDCGTSYLTGTLDLYHVGWNSVDVSISLSAGYLGDHSGFLTLGDNNLGITDPQQGISQLVEPGWIIGVARGLIPWVGAIKLALEGESSYVPPQTWQFLGLTIAGLILLAVGIHYAFRAEGIEDPRRKAEEEDEEDGRDERAEADDEEPERPRGGWAGLAVLRPWHRKDEELEEESAARSGARDSKDGGSPSGARRGRPRPQVRRPPRKKPSREEDEDEL